MATSILRSRALPVLSSLRYGSHRPSPAVLPVTHVRFVNTDKEELGGVGGSEPPGPQRNPVNWKAGTITAVGVILAGGWMLRSKSKQSTA